MAAPVPDQLASHTAVAYEDKMLVYGGTGSPFGQSISNTVFVLDFAMRYVLLFSKGTQAQLYLLA